MGAPSSTGTKSAATLKDESPHRCGLRCVLRRCPGGPNDGRVALGGDRVRFLEAEDLLHETLKVGGASRDARHEAENAALLNDGREPADAEAESLEHRPAGVFERQS